MKIPVFVGCALSALSLLFLSEPAEAQAETAALDTLKSTFEAQQKDLQSAQNKFDERYAGELKKLEKAAAAEGKLELVLAIRKEAENFKERKDQEATSTQPELARLQKIYSDQTAAIAAGSEKKLGELVVAYVKQLNALKIDLTKATEIEAAVAVQAEVTRAEALVKAAPADVSKPSSTSPDPPEAKAGTAELIGHWTFDGDARDSSEHGHDGRLVGAEIVEGHIGSGALKTGKGFAEVPHDPSFNLQHPFSLSLWAYREPKVAQSSSAFLFVKYGKTWGVQLDGNGKTLGFHLGVTGPRDLPINLEEGDFREGKWHHLAAVFDGKSTFLYVDGRERGTWEGDDDLAVRISGGNLQIGGVTNGTRNFFGMLDDLRIYKGVLTRNEIQALSKADEANER